MTTAKKHSPIIEVFGNSIFTQPEKLKEIRLRYVEEEEKARSKISLAGRKP